MLCKFLKKCTAMLMNNVTCRLTDLDNQLDNMIDYDISYKQPSVASEQPSRSSQ